MHESKLLHFCGCEFCSNIQILNYERELAHFSLCDLNYELARSVNVPIISSCQLCLFCEFPPLVCIFWNPSSRPFHEKRRLKLYLVAFLD